jgi:hypothetical protein
VLQVQEKAEWSSELIGAWRKDKNVPPNGNLKKKVVWEKYQEFRHPNKSAN